ncbi:hypothetical protein EW145_g3694 [Phellinidium pouzarii]|uniref:Major facilitator superfamily (MFS) profile domain-containing protein n=1 Tax=Phellinidium pouzarii TaxID=167371 RepID=A0A4S4L831_9AGAM|nr:hypothetical protein EW145_g3694 [Phellinidium pouzarii]
MSTGLPLASDKELDSASLEKGSLHISERAIDGDTTLKQRGRANAAVDFGGDSTLPAPPVLTAQQERALYRKIDLRLMPILSLMYLCSFLDRGNIGNAKLAGLVTQLDLVGNQYNIALPYCLAECPANLVLKKFRPSRWLPGITIVWGIVMTLMGLVKTYPQLIGVRVCLGVAEAGLFPGVVYYLTFWYPRHKLQYRIGLFLGAATLAGAFSGLLAFAIEFMGDRRGLEAWSWIFILEGIATVVVGCISIFILVDFPVTASFLTPEERAYVLWKKNSIISGFGFTTPITQLLSVPPYIFATIMLLVFGHYSDKLKMRSPFIVIGLTMCLIGFAINISAAPRGAKYFGTFFCVAGSYASFPGVVSWLGNNLAGQYKRGVGMALHIGIGNFAGAIASNIYRTQDQPCYIVGHGIELMFVGIGFLSIPLTIFLYTRINAQRAAELAQTDGVVQLSVEELHELGDRAPDFKYTL